MTTNEWTDADSVTLSALLVARDGHQMRLTGAERVAAIRMMADRGLSSEAMADRLRVSADVVSTAARRAGIAIPRLDDGFYKIAYPRRDRWPSRRRATA